MVELLAALEPQVRVALRWPLTELALARMQDLEQAPRRALLMLLREVLDQSGACQPRAWIDFALMTRRLAPELSPSTLRAPGAEPVAARHVPALPMMLPTEPEPIVREWLRLLRLVLDAPTGRPARLTLPESLLSQ